MASHYRHKWGQDGERCTSPKPMGDVKTNPKGAMIVCRWCGHELIKVGKA